MFLKKNSFHIFDLSRNQSVQISALKDGEGDWRSIEVGMSTARVHKRSVEMLTVLTMAPIGKKIVFSMGRDVRSALGEALP